MCLSATFWTFWTWLPTYFARSYHLVLKDSAIFTFGRAVRRGVRRHRRRLAQRRDFAAYRPIAHRPRRPDRERPWSPPPCSIGPVLFIRDVNLAALALAGGYFFIRMAVSPTWAVCTDIAPAWAGAAGGMLNTGSGDFLDLRAAGVRFIADLTGNYSIPFSASLWPAVGRRRDVCRHAAGPSRPGRGLTPRQRANIAVVDATNPAC